MKHGQGKYTYADGGYYSGQWAYNEKQGMKYKHILMEKNILATVG